jgi:ankyrin repeat protein
MAALYAAVDMSSLGEVYGRPGRKATDRHSALDIIAMLLERGANPNLANRGGWTPLYLATDNRNIEGGDYPVSKGDMDTLEFIKLLLDKKADPNAAIRENTLTRTIFTMQWFFEDGVTPFIRASQSSDTALMKLLLDYGADPKHVSAYGDTALTASAGIGWVEGVTYERSAKENVEAVRMLLDLGLDPNHANRDGRTPLMGAALKGRSEVIQMLVDKGAKIDQRDNGSRDTDKVGSLLAGHTWQALDYADGLVRTGVQSAVQRPEAAALIRKMMTDRGLPVPPPNRVVDSICVVELCAERTPAAPQSGGPDGPRTPKNTPRPSARTPGLLVFGEPDFGGPEGPPCGRRWSAISARNFSTDTPGRQDSRRPTAARLR